MTQKETAASGQNTSTAKADANEDPALQLERDLPSDGRDEIGEAMIRDLPKKPELAEPHSQPDHSSNPS
ncbi:hypothetical protein RCH06_002551 [Polaromonas sp. CG_9.5]|uniref:hypothetical protein n=1 Tax=Polaromonas sp. CG_9.5 TaxID=3071705 RepID=UPI002DFBD95F|nr:hypothetical protein [Polaromonas sp. CG_9.5]